VLFGPLEWSADLPPIYADPGVGDIFTSYDVVIVQKLSGPNTIAFLDTLKQKGISTIFVDCDLPLKLECAAKALRVVCTSRWLCNKYSNAGIRQTVFISDAVEWQIPPRFGLRNSMQLRAVWFGIGHQDNWELVENLRHLISERSRWQLVTVSNHPNSDVKWRLNRAARDIASCDVAVFPSRDDELHYAKSSNRVVQAMALGLPVIAHPLPSYQEVVRDGWNGFLCRSDQEWLKALEQLEDPKLRMILAANAYEYALSKYSINVIGRQWENLFRSLIGGETLDKHTFITFPQFAYRRVSARAYVQMAQSQNASACNKTRYILKAMTEWPFQASVGYTDLIKGIYIQVKAYALRATNYVVTILRKLFYIDHNRG